MHNLPVIGRVKSRTGGGGSNMFWYSDNIESDESVCDDAVS